MSTTTILQITQQQSAARRLASAKRDATPPAPAPTPPARQEHVEPAPPCASVFAEAHRRWPGKSTFTAEELYACGLPHRREVFCCPSA